MPELLFILILYSVYIYVRKSLMNVPYEDYFENENNDLKQ